jgi:hypothetical protein
MSDLQKLLTNAVSRETATSTIRNWIEYASGALKFSRKDVPKAIHIPMIDINNLMAAFESFDKDKRKLSGFRIYFTRKYSVKEKPEGVQLTCVVVPTVNEGSADNPHHKDAIITIPSTAGKPEVSSSVAARVASESGGTETIYNFTSPCPTDCSGTTDWES